MNFNPYMILLVVGLVLRKVIKVSPIKNPFIKVFNKNLDDCLVELDTNRADLNISYGFW